MYMAMTFWLSFVATILYLHKPFVSLDFKVRYYMRILLPVDINHNIPIAKKFIMKSIGSLDHPVAKWLLTQIENGNEVILEITPTYYSTWRSAIPAIEQ